MARPIWQGQIAFGLVNVPVGLYSVEHRSDISFHLVDSRNSARVRYERVNEETGEEVPWDKVAKAYEYDSGNYVVFTDEELEKASVEMTRTIEIERFVALDAIDSLYFSKPYYLVPDKGGEKGYVLLREAMAAAEMAGIARVVIRTRQYLSALVARGTALVLDLLRFDQELRKPSDFDLPGREARTYKVSKKEIELAGQLIKGMAGPWKPSEYRDEYRDVLMKIIESKIETGQTQAIDTDEEPREERATVNFMDALKRSLKKGTAKPARGAAAASRRPKRTKRKAG
jgi:DNA end-binding protein Ku